LANEIHNNAERLYAFVQHFGRRLRDIDVDLKLSPARFSVLASLAFHGKSNVGELALFERVRRPSITRLVKDTERDRLVRRATDPSDGRRVLVEITAKGPDLMRVARARKVNMVKQKLKDEKKVTTEALAVVLDSLESLADDGSDSHRSAAKRRTRLQSRESLQEALIR
jgi:DNA-binding MarR family transcriptional regulator